MKEENVKTIYDKQICKLLTDPLAENVGILYRDEDGSFHFIDFSECAKNYSSNSHETDCLCVGDRDIPEKYFLFYTSETKTKVLFKKMPRVRKKQKFPKAYLVGNKVKRFHTLDKRITSFTKYRTYDLT